MKVAELENGQQIRASGSAPTEALCPVCRGKVVLRKRKKMASAIVTYFWRHLDGKNTKCSARWKLG